jgi:cardiolipin synthase
MSDPIEKKSSEKFFTVSNMLSLSRIAIVIPIIYYLQKANINPEYNVYALIIMVIGGLTDTFDGLLARRMNQITEFGKIVDPIADKIGVAAILIFLAYSRKDFPGWFLAVVLGRDALIFLVGLYVKGKYNYVFMSNLLGKITVTVLAVMTTVFVVKDLFDLDALYRFLFWVTLTLLVSSFVAYAQRLRNFLNNPKELA